MSKKPTKVTPSKAQDPHGTNGGNGAYAKKQGVPYTKNPQRKPKGKYDYAGNNVLK